MHLNWSPSNMSVWSGGFKNQTWLQRTHTRWWREQPHLASCTAHSATYLIENFLEVMGVSVGQLGRTVSWHCGSELKGHTASLGMVQAAAGNTQHV